MLSVSRTPDGVCMKRVTSGNQYAFRVSLKRRKSIWRTVVLRGDQTLDDLHETIFTAFDRDDEHLYSFYFPNAAARRSQRGAQFREYAAPYGFEPEALTSDGRYNAAAVRLDDLKLKEGQTFEYLFDFGDEWWHEIKVEALGASDRTKAYPQIVDKRGASPAQYPEVDE